MSETLLKSKTVLIDRQPVVLYSALGDLRALVKNLPEDRQATITATQDTISANMQGFNFGMKVVEREPFNRITFVQTDGTPIEFQIHACFDTVDDPSDDDADCKTNFHLELATHLSGMLKIMLGSKLQGVLDRLTDTIAAAAEGRTPDISMESFM